VVLCVDEKSQIQALDRTQPGLPMKKGRAQTMTHDYIAAFIISSMALAGVLFVTQSAEVPTKPAGASQAPSAHIGN
jgi:hypothetical protein